jgi:hypothetical protein
MSNLIEGTIKEVNTQMAEARIAKAKPFIKAERDISARVEKLHAQLIETQEDFHLNPENILMAVKVGLALADKPPLMPTSLNGTPEGTVFNMPALSGAWARCIEGLPHPFSGVIRPITFDHAVAKGRSDVVLVHLNHRLVQMCLRLLRAQVWAQDDVKKLHRITVKSLPDSQLDSSAILIVSRLVITGGNYHRLHEELTLSGGYLKDQSFRREEGVAKLDSWSNASSPAAIDDSQFDLLSKRFASQQESIFKAIEARSKERLTSLIKTLDNYKQKEVANIKSVLENLEKSIRAELEAESEPKQLSLFSEDERTQVTRDAAALKARLERIPHEIKMEVEAIERRYENFIERTFPVAIIFLVPKSSVKKK